MKKIVLIIMMNLLSLISFSKGIGNDHGNGGDDVRATFIRRGKEITQFLMQTDKGTKIASEHNLKIYELEKSLDIYKIQVVNGPLIDNTGSVVDAIGVPGLIKLDGQKWDELLNSTKDTYYLILHEMLRSASVNDDNYIISSKINPFMPQKLIKQRIEIENIILWADKIIAHTGNEEFWGATAEGYPCRFNLYKNKKNDFGPRYYFSLGTSPDTSKDDSKFTWIGGFLDRPVHGFNDIEITSEHVYFNMTDRYFDGPNDSVGVFATESLNIILDKNRFPKTVYGESTRSKNEICHLDPITTN